MTEVPLSYRGTDTPHYQIHLCDGPGTDYRAAVNVLSQQAPPDLLHIVVEDFRLPVPRPTRHHRPADHRP
ncbi:DUF2278 family protein [Kitasatospora sp. NPDC048545]|uniref:DUF2278 family protein n=1 Tax=Kitasatospora sp. NPDC048545 TaxID=3157208 RepID=UPI0033C2EFDC